MASRGSSSVLTVLLRPTRVLLAAVAAASVLLTGCLFSPEKSRAARGMELALQDDATFLIGGKRVTREKGFNYARQLGVTRLRVNLLWSYTMPRDVYNARRKPARIQYLFDQVDTLVDEAARKGIRVHLSLTGPAPRWARPKPSIQQAWYKPNSREFGKWAGVVAQHFAGRVDRYSIWNEPNWRTWLGPLKSAPGIYRSLYSRGYAAIKKADPRAKVLIGETSPTERKGLSTAPLAFLRKVLCVNATYKRSAKCPKLKADGYAHHPYDFAHAPNFKYPGADNVTLGTLSRLTKALDKLSRSGALRHNGGGRMPVYLTEYGYFATGHRALPAKKRVRYLQQGYSIALKNSRVKSQLQYLLVSPPKSSSSAFFNLALLTTRGAKYPQYNGLVRWFKANRGKVRRPGGALAIPAARPNPLD
jgi:Cellulase (glycosyl hydrolase family 5)